MIKESLLPKLNQKAIFISKWIWMKENEAACICKVPSVQRWSSHSKPLIKDFTMYLQLIGGILLRAGTDFLLDTPTSESLAFFAFKAFTDPCIKNTFLFFKTICNLYKIDSADFFMKILLQIGIDIRYKPIMRLSFPSLKWQCWIFLMKILLYVGKNTRN